jgi:tetratricopeptide (TPR) repeat protein
VALLEPLVRDAPETFFFRREVLASALIALGDLAKDDGNSREAEQAFRGALEQLAIVQRARPHETATADRVQTTHAKIADVYRHAGRLAESRVEAGKAIAIAEGIVRDHPDWPNARSRLARYHYALGINVKALGDFDAAEKSLTRAEALLEALVREQPDVVSHQRLLHDVRFVQATVALAVGRIDRALAFADTLAARGEGGDFYNAACFYALASGVCERTCPARVEPFAARSVDLLRHSHSRGFLTVSSNIKHLMTDSDLAALRARADFRALVEALIFRHDPFAR